MFPKSFVFATLLLQSTAFQSSTTKLNTASKPETKSFEFYGDIEPLGFFDPLQVTKTCDEKTLQYMREAEIHHGRIAMTSAILLPLIDKLNPNELAINVLSRSGTEFNDIALSSMGFFELARMTALYKSPRFRLFELRDDVQPGQLNPYTKLNITQANKELSNGRLAMIGVLGYIVQELVSNEKIIS